MIDKSELARFFASVAPGVRQLLRRLDDPELWVVPKQRFVVVDGNGLEMRGAFFDVVHDALLPLREGFTTQAKAEEVGWAYRALMSILHKYTRNTVWEDIPSVYGYQPDEVLYHLREDDRFDTSASFWWLPYDDALRLLLAMYPGSAVEIYRHADEVTLRERRKRGSNSFLPNLLPWSAVARTFHANMSPQHALNVYYAVWLETLTPSAAENTRVLLDSLSLPKEPQPASPYYMAFTRQPGQISRGPVFYEMLYPWVDITLQGGMEGTNPLTNLVDTEQVFS